MGLIFRAWDARELTGSCFEGRKRNCVGGESSKFSPPKILHKRWTPSRDRHSKALYFFFFLPGEEEESAINFNC